MQVFLVMMIGVCIISVYDQYLVKYFCNDLIGFYLMFIFNLQIGLVLLKFIYFNGRVYNIE